jgi:CheY-like chemotaxis protein
VLLVEDDAGIRNVVADALHGAGYLVSVVPDGFAALNYVRRGAPDLVILDLGLPVLDGQEFLDAWRTVSPLERVPIVVLSGSADIPPSLARGGVQAHITKPFDVEALLATVGRVSVGPRA